MKLSDKARARLLVINLCCWVIGAAAVAVLFSGPRGLMSTVIAPIGEELGGWPGLLSAAAGFDPDPAPQFEIAFDHKAIGAALSLPGRPGADSPWFPGRVRIDGAEASVWLQLVASGGDTQLESQVWRVRFESDNEPLAGEIELTPQQPGIHAREAAIRETAHALGLIAPPHGFVSVRVNDLAVGSYFWSQRDGATTLSELGYPRGGMLQSVHDSRVSTAGTHAATTRLVSRRFQSPTGATNASRRDEAAERQLARLIELADRASDGEFDRRVGELLDIDKFLHWNALAWVFGTSTDGSLPRLAWYLDPVTGLLEPIVQDWAEQQGPIEPSLLRLGDPAQLSARLLANPQHRAARNQLLWSWVVEGQGDVIASAQERLAAALTRRARSTISIAGLRELSNEAQYARVAREALQNRRSQIDAALQAAEVRIRRADSEGRSPTLAVDLEPRGLAEIELAEVRLELDTFAGDTTREAREPEAGRSVSAAGPAASPSGAAATLRLFDPEGVERHRAHPDLLVEGSSVRVSLSDFGVIETGTRGDTWRLEMEWPFLRHTDGGRNHVAMIEFGFRNAVTGQWLPPARLFGPPGQRLADSDSPRGSADGSEAVSAQDDAVGSAGLPLVVEGDRWVLPAGSHRLTRTLVVPSDLRLQLEPGVTLRIDPGAGIVTYRGMIARGTALLPIEIQRADPDRPWGAIGIARAPEPSELDFVSITGGSKLRFGGLEFDGQLSFNASDFSMDHSNIRGSSADGLATKRSDFAIHRSFVVGNANDGVESEWSTGRVTDTDFVDNGDDGLDLADSEITVADCRFGDMSDKAISADVGSIVTVTHTRLDQSGIAIASKNGSRVDARESVFRNNRLGFAVYRDNPLFDGGLGTVVGGVFHNNVRDFSIEPGSELELIDISRDDVETYGTAWSVRGPSVLRVADNQSSMLYNSTPSNGKKRY